MKKSVLVSVALLSCTLLGAPGLAEAKPACRPSKLFGHVSEISQLRIGSGSEPGIRSEGNRWSIGAGTEVCAGDLIINPGGSNWVIKLLTRNGKEETIAPGDQFTPPADQVPSDLARLIDRLLKPINRSDKQTPSMRAVAPRGNSSCDFSPSGQKSLSAFAVKEWGPLFLTWECGANEEKVWIVTLWTASGDVIRNSPETQNFATLDISKCDAGCMVTVSQFAPPNKIVLATEVRLVTSLSANLPMEVMRLPDDPIKAALIGGVLLRRPPNDGWHLQATSLLFGAGCDVPAAGALAKDVMGFSDVMEPCSNARIEQTR